MNEQIIDRICDAFTGATSVTGITGIAYRAWQEDDLNILCLHEAVTEWCSGAHDGAYLIQGFGVELNELIALFDTMPELHLDATLPTGEEEVYDSPSVTLEGEIDGEPWLVRICTSPPADAEPGVGTDGVRFWHKTEQ
ncbi:MAG: hypothetical protein ACODAQ_01330 [Phycisphaeraceae bacterium]